MPQLTTCPCVNCDSVSFTQRYDHGSIFCARIGLLHLQLLCCKCSVDRLMVSDFCDLAGQDSVLLNVNGSSNQARAGAYCNTSAVYMQHIWLNGAAADGRQAYCGMLI